MALSPKSTIQGEDVSPSARPSNNSYAGWGKTHTSRSAATVVPARQEPLATIPVEGGDHLIPRGLGRSYGDMATIDGGVVIDMSQLNAIESFDESTGVAICQAGVTIRDLASHLLPAGYVPPTCPGTGFVSVGGAIANDVHGKNHDSHGSFGRHIEWIELLIPAQGLLRVSAADNPALFNATLGGIGLTGIIVRAAIRARRVPSNAVILEKRVVRSLDEFVEVMLEPQGATYSVGWVNITASRRTSGRGLLQLAKYADTSVPERRNRYFTMPAGLQLPLVNRATSTVFNAFYYRVSRQSPGKPIYYPAFVFPLDRITNWNNFYSRAGVYQFQCVIDNDRALEAYRKILALTAEQGMVSPLAVLKNFGEASGGLLSFPRPGITLAMDLPASPKSAYLISRLYDLVIDYTGRVYLAKDALMSPRQFEAMYPELDAFRGELAKVDPAGRLQSDMSRRLGIFR